MKKNFAIFFVLLIIGACSKNDDFVIKSDNQNIENLVPMDPAEINQEIKTFLKETGNFNWNDASDYMLWSASVHGQNVVTVGYGNSSFSETKSTENEAIKSQLIQKISDLENISNSKNKSGNAILLYEDEDLNFIDIEVKSIETIKELRTDKNVRYIEPAGYQFFAYETQMKSSSGCTTTADAVNSGDYRTISPNCLVSWTYDEHNITQAWTLSTGQGITVGLIDTGVSDYQSLLGSGFNDGYSSGRYIQKYGSYVDSWKWWSTTTDGYHDKCGHGTSMAATIASPRNDNGMPVGVAYNCNLVSYRGTSDVVLDGYQEQKGVANALTGLANNSSVKVISMSIGHIFTVGRIEDAVKYAYAKGKMIIAAGGTSTTFTNFVGVIFPANMNETVAVTGITSDNSYNECDVCHEGSQIDFTVVMSRYWDENRNSVCLGYYNNTKDYVGGSSVATSTTAGIAALIWARHPSWTRAQVFDKMKQSAELYNNPSSSFGYGNIDAYQAVL
ncbi:MAG: S8 family serine peptidase [Bacteroidales bacterium]|nr:S8 family serine peptidase [Bacteroidales bacterium]MBN2758713.1 S8 family serine peptidase [Bacteroidales bacterium]